MQGHSPLVLSRRHLTRLGDLTLLLLLFCTNGMWVDRVGVLVVRFCIRLCFVLCWVPLFYPATAPRGSGLLSVDVECVSCRARVCWVCFRFVMCKRNSRQSDDALPIGLPQSDYLAHLVDYVYDSLRRFAHRLSCCRFWARRSNSVPRDDSPASCERCTTLLLASCKECQLFHLSSGWSDVLI